MRSAFPPREGHYDCGQPFHAHVTAGCWSNEGGARLVRVPTRLARPRVGRSRDPQCPDLRPGMATMALQAGVHPWTRRPWRSGARRDAASEALGLATGRAALEVDDPAAPERDHLEALAPPAVLVQPLRRPDDDVVSDLLELRLYVEVAPTALLEREPQDLTGLGRAASGRRALPPKAAVGHPSPLGVLREQGRERLRISSVERLGGRAQLVDHTPSMARSPTLSGRPRPPKALRPPTAAACCKNHRAGAKGLPAFRP